jgi:outer membrane protein assembly factor BamA
LKIKNKIFYTHVSRIYNRDFQSKVFSKSLIINGLKPYRLIVFFLLFLQLFSLAANSDSTKTKHTKLLAFPIVFFLPETNWGGGLAGVFRFKQKQEPDSIRFSNITFAFSATQLKQVVLSVPFQIWLKQEKYNIYGEFGYQSENYLYFGIGNKIPSSFEERYYLKVARIRVNFLRRIHKRLFTGVFYSLESTSLFDLIENGSLKSGTVPGSNAGLTSSAGVSIKYDNRDGQFYATKGYYLELNASINNKITGSDYNFEKYSLNVSKYIHLGLKKVLAFNAYTQINHKDVPFYQMATLGGDARMRGIYNGRYRDKSCWVFQAEYRQPLIWKLGATVFLGLGDVAPALRQFEVNNTRFTYGGGLRILIDKQQHLNIRLDAGVSRRQVSFYFTFAEAF